MQFLNCVPETGIGNGVMIMILKIGTIMVAVKVSASFIYPPYRYLLLSPPSSLFIFLFLFISLSPFPLLPSLTSTIDIITPHPAPPQISSPPHPPPPYHHSPPPTSYLSPHYVIPIPHPSFPLPSTSYPTPYR